MLSAPSVAAVPPRSLAADFFEAGQRKRAQVKADPLWTAQPGPQREFTESTADEVLYGGAAGGGKSSAVVALPLRWAALPHYRALILRRETPQLVDLLDKARGIYKTGVAGTYRGAYPAAEFRGDKGLWTFPSGAQVRFNHCQLDKDAFDYQGHEYPTIIFDELTHFTEAQYLEVKSRNRSGHLGTPCYTRATTNPGGPGHEWVFKRWGPWLDSKVVLPDWAEEVVWTDGTVHTVRGVGLPPRTGEDGRPLPPAPGGMVLYVAKVGESERFSTQPFTVDRVSETDVVSTSRTFIPARLSDNPALLRSDPGYRAKLRDNDPVRRAQLEDGNWLVHVARGLYFKREWVTFVDAVPADARSVRAWDKAATEPHPGSPDPDWTRGVRMAYAASTDRFYISGLASLRGGPGAVKALIKATAELDGKGVKIRLPQDPGAAGKSDAADDVRSLQGWTVTAKPVTGDKVTRFGPFSSQASPQSTGGLTGRVCIVRGAWNETLVQELEDFPLGVHDDVADCVSDAFEEAQRFVIAPGPSCPRPSFRTDDAPLGL